MAKIIDGKALAAQVKARVREEAEKLPRKPGLAVILVGENPATADAAGINAGFLSGAGADWFSVCAVSVQAGGSERAAGGR